MKQCVYIIRNPETTCDCTHRDISVTLTVYGKRQVISNPKDTSCLLLAWPEFDPGRRHRKPNLEQNEHRPNRVSLPAMFKLKLNDICPTATDNLWCCLFYVCKAKWLNCCNLLEVGDLAWWITLWLSSLQLSHPLITQIHLHIAVPCPSGMLINIRIAESPQDTYFILNSCNSLI